MSRWIIGLILIFFLFVIAPMNQGKEKVLDSAELYDVAMELYYKGEYGEAIKTFSKLIDTFPKSQSVPYARYMTGQSYLQMGKFEEALQQFEIYVKAYPDGYRVKDAETGIQIASEKMKERALLPSPHPLPPAPSASNQEQGKRRICAQVFFLDAKDLEEVEKKMKDLKKVGVDTVILRVFQNKGDRMYKFVQPRYDAGVYFQTEHAPVVDDILGRLTEIAHRNGLDIFAWMNTRYAYYGLDGKSDHPCISYNFEKKRMEVSRGLTLFHADVLKRLEGLFRDLGRYPIDGILLQDDLILKHNEDFSPDASKAFLREFGYSPHPDLFYIDPYRSESGKYYVRAYTDRFWTWANWKTQWLMNVAQRLMAAARESNPNLKFGINLYYETVLNPTNGVAWFSQNLSEVLKKDFDYYAVMAYHRQTMKELKMEEKQAIALMSEVAQKTIQSVGEPSKVMMKVQIIDWKNYEVIPTKEMQELLAGIFLQGKVSLAFVPYLDHYPLQLLKSTWNASPK